MPKRILDGEAVWSSVKLSQVEPVKYRAEFANLVPLALANGTFECNPAIIWQRVYAFNRPDITLDDVIAMLNEFERVKMLFRWPAHGKTWGYWVGIETAGRLPPPSQLKQKKYPVGPEVPRDRLTEFAGDCRYLSGTEPVPDSQVGIGFGFGVGTGTGEVKEPSLSLSKSENPERLKSCLESEQDSCPSKTVRSSLSCPTEAPGSGSAVHSQPSLLDWNEDVGGLPAARIRAAIKYHLNDNPNQYYREKLSASYVRRNAQKLVDDVPEAWWAKDDSPPVMLEVFNPVCQQCEGTGNVRDRQREVALREQGQTVTSKLYARCGCAMRFPATLSNKALLAEFNSLSDRIAGHPERKTKIYKLLTGEMK